MPRESVLKGVERFVKDWFPENKVFKISFEEGKVVIDKRNYEKVILNKLSIDTNGLKIDMVINLEN